VTYRKGSPVLILAVILLLAACGGTASSSSVTHTPTATPAAAAAGLVKGEFVGEAIRLPADRTVGIALSTNGRQLIAYLCNGIQPMVLAEWFKGPVTSNRVDITNTHGSHLAATVTAQAITGTVTLKDGTYVPFIAHLIPDPGSYYGLFRSEETVHGMRYLGGWIIYPVPLASARTGTGTEATLTSVMVPHCCCCLPDRDGVIINEQTGALIVSADVENIASVTVPGLGPFRLTACREARC
jgi:hypothetical protein